MRGFWLCLALLFAAALGGENARAADPNALWHIVHDRCVPDQAGLKTPLPCVTVDPVRGYAILKDIRGASQFLLIPTARVTGIEDPAILEPKAPPYWEEAWEERNDVAAMAGGRALDATQLSLAVNSSKGRTQNQLHIHMDCIAPAVRAAIAAHPPATGAGWTAFPVPLAGHPYQVRIVSSLIGKDGDPFAVAAADLPGAREAMGDVTLLVTGADPKGGHFVMLAGRADPAHGIRASAEELQDHGCAVAHEQAPASPP